MMKVIATKNNPPTIVRERILGLVQYWADAFTGKIQLVAVVELYEQLKNDGIEFPPVDLDNLAPVETQGRPQVNTRAKCTTFELLVRLHNVIIPSTIYFEYKNDVSRLFCPP